MQIAYDDASDHCRNKEQQALWKVKIKNRLNELKAYADYD